jgi:hypothetical protein
LAHQRGVGFVIVRNKANCRQQELHGSLNAAYQPNGIALELKWI